MYAYEDAGAGTTTVWSTVIPEPATLGLVTALGVGLLFIRRTFLL